MNYHIAIKFHGVDEVLIQFQNSDLAQDFLHLFHRHCQQCDPIVRDRTVYSLDRLRELAQQCKHILGWDWIHDRYDDIAVTTQMHKDIERYLSNGFGTIPQEHDALLHELHICLHSIQRLEYRRTSIQLEWFTDSGFSLDGYDFEFTHDRTLGAVYLINPHVGHPPDWLWRQNDHTNVWQTCRFHDFVKPGLVISMAGSLEKNISEFIGKYEYIEWWKLHAPDFFNHHGLEKMIRNTGRPVIGYVINNAVLLELAKQEQIILEHVRFHDQLHISSTRLDNCTTPTITQQDYESLAGPDWPSYDSFCHGIRPGWVWKEITQMTGITET